MRNNLSFTVLGSGRWGTSMAIYLASVGLRTTLFCPNEAKYRAITENRRNPVLPEQEIPDNLEINSDLSASIKNLDVLVVSTPVIYLRSMLSELTATEKFSKKTLILGINKGIERDTLQIPPQICKDFFPMNPYAHLGGPCFPAGLIEEGRPAAETLASDDYDKGLEIQELISSPWFRIYLSRDVNGVAYVGALKNVYAIAAGILEGLNLNEEAMSILVTRALSEMRRFCKYMLIPDETLFGLSGLGDLTLTCYSGKSSHNKTFGKLFVECDDLDSINQRMGNSIAEGYYTTTSTQNLCEKFRIDMPIVSAVYQILYEGLSPKSALLDLMNRPLKMED